MTPPPIIVDAGANIGAFTLLAAQRFPKAKILSFEPEIENYDLLMENINLNHLSGRVTAIKHALAEKIEERIFYISNFEYAHSLLKEQVADSNKTELVVKCVTLPQIMQDYNITFIDILKLDIEGSEYEVLYQLPNEIYNKIGAILLEIHTSDLYKREDLIEFLKKHGFHVSPSPTHPRVFICTKSRNKEL